MGGRTPSSESQSKRWLARRLPDLQAGFWFLATAVALIGPVLMLIVLVIDKAAGPAGVFESLAISPSAARTILGAIAGSLITIASLTSSLTIVTLQLLSSQYTPRAIRGFLRGRLSQVVFGTFIGIFIYCLLLLVSVHAPGEANDPFVPSLGVVVAIALALASLGLLVAFIHHMAQTIQVSTMAARIGKDTLRAIARVHPEAYDPGAEEDLDEVAAAPPPSGEEVDRSDRIIHPSRTGYVLLVDVGGLAEVAAGSGLELEVVVRPGDFVTVGGTAITIDGDRPAPATLIRAAAREIAIGHERDLDRDPSFGIRHLIDIALRAISPGINDPTTAITCINYLQDVFETLAARSLPGALKFETGSATVIARQRRFAEYVEPLSEIARYSTGDARVAAALVSALTATAASARAAGAVDRSLLLSELVADLTKPAVDDARTAHDRELLDDAATENV